MFQHVPLVCSTLQGCFCPTNKTLCDPRSSFIVFQDPRRLYCVSICTAGLLNPQRVLLHKKMANQHSHVNPGLSPNVEIPQRAVPSWSLFQNSPKQGTNCFEKEKQRNSAKGTVPPQKQPENKGTPIDWPEEELVGRVPSQASPDPPSCAWGLEELPVGRCGQEGQTAGCEQV